MAWTPLLAHCSVSLLSRFIYESFQLSKRVAWQGIWTPVGARMTAPTMGSSSCSRQWRLGPRQQIATPVVRRGTASGTAIVAASV